MTSTHDIEPFTARLRAEPVHGVLDAPQAAVTLLLEEVAQRALAAGAVLLGHLKCHVIDDSGARFHANLTDLRSGPRVAGDSPTDARWLEVDLVVLVIGLHHERIARVVEESLAALGERTGSRWTIEVPLDHHLPTP